MPKRKNNFIGHFKCPVCEVNYRNVIRGNKIEDTCLEKKCQIVFQRIYTIWYKRYRSRVVEGRNATKK